MGISCRPRRGRREGVRAAGKGQGCGRRAGLQKRGVASEKDEAREKGLQDKVGLQVKAPGKGKGRVAGQDVWSSLTGHNRVEHMCQAGDLRGAK